MARNALLSDLAHSLDALLKVGECPKRLIPAVERLGLPFWLADFLSHCWANEGAYVHGGYHLDSLSDILKHEELQKLLAARMFPIGSAGNGDEIVIRFDDDGGAVGMLSHEELYGRAKRLDYHQVVSTLEEFLLRIVEKQYLPIDSYAAREYTNLREEMKRDGNP